MIALRLCPLPARGSDIALRTCMGGKNLSLSCDYHVVEGNTLRRASPAMTVREHLEEGECVIKSSGWVMVWQWACAYLRLHVALPRTGRDKCRTAQRRGVRRRQLKSARVPNSWVPGGTALLLEFYGRLHAQMVSLGGFAEV